ncbi:DUF4019 domain-containing protein [Vreelandella populi]|uniref:DUF4019 domain-containing protein n=1 Tax=Vreelandella populi TaxID=2498858 RepID=A0A3S0WQI0_9GAMM|nr:DUF4019 domain-containing protein [Halomonas populi]RUR40828.1 DUF4019 domain-containing protein [Halomonas populi]RUR49335.1 DUF4019 domain-containing protein [Halomonas populi]
MPKTLTCFITTLLLLAPYAQANTDAAEAAVLAWLEAIDSGEYELAWEKASPLLQRPLSPNMLERTISAARRDFGTVESRRRTRVINETSMPGAPKNDYREFTYQTRFSNKPNITETITPHFEEGVWKVSGYYVQ